MILHFVAKDFFLCSYDANMTLRALANFRLLIDKKKIYCILLFHQSENYFRYFVLRPLTIFLFLDFKNKIELEKTISFYNKLMLF